MLQGGVWSNPVNLTVSTPNITSVTPTTAIAGTQITITGTAFGASQSSGNVWLGSTYGQLCARCRQGRQQRRRSCRFPIYVANYWRWKCQNRRSIQLDFGF